MATAPAPTDETPPETPPAEPETSMLEDQLEAIEPRYEAHEWVVTDSSGFSRVYVQRPLSFQGKLQVTALLGSTLKKAMENGMSLDSVMKTVDDATGTSDFAEFVQSLVTLVEYAPDLISNICCISLCVPVGERDWVKEVWDQPEGEGGQSDDEGMEMIEVFVDQNAKALQDFFKLRLPQVAKRVGNRLGVKVSPPSKPSKRTRARTASE